MSDFANDELLSAYLDDGLSADDRARVERMLAEQPESRQVLEELRAIKASLERMPRVRLGHDFAEQVLRQAEKEVLTHGVDSTDAVERTSAVDRMGGFTWQRLRRPVIWASLALAAGLLIMFLDRDRARPRQVAMAPPAGGRGVGIGAPAAAPAEGPPENRLGENEKAAGANDRFGVNTPAAPAEPAADERAPAGAAGPPAKPRDMKAGQDERSAGLAGGTAAAARRNAASKDMPADAETDAVADLNQMTRLESIAGDDTLVVWCYLTPGVNADRSFREVLAEQNIEWAAETPVDQLNSLGRNFAYREDRSAGRAKRPAREAESEGLGLLRGRREGQQEQAKEAIEQAARDPNAELVLVEASEPQIEAVLEALDRDSENVAAVEVEPAANMPQQRQYARYARGLSELKEAQQRKSRPTAEYFSKKEPRAEPGQLPPSSKSLPAEAKQSQSQGIARRLLLRGATLSDGMDDKRALATSGKVAQQSDKADKGTDAVDAKKELPKLQGGAQDLAEKNRVQVLFVISPADEQPPAAAEPKK